MPAGPAATPRPTGSAASCAACGSCWPAWGPPWWWRWWPAALTQKRRAASNAERAEAETRRAEAARRESDLNRLVAESKAGAAATTDVALLLALEANRLEDTARTQAPIFNALQAEPRFLGGLGDRQETTIAWARPDGSIQTAGVSGAFRRWDLATHRELHEPRRFEPSTELRGSVLAVGGRHLAVGVGPTIRVYDADTGMTAGPAITDDLADGRLGRPMALSADGRTLYVGGGPFAAPATAGFGLIARFDVATGQAVGEPWRAHATGITALELSPDGGRLATGARDGTLAVWDTRTGQTVAPPVAGHRSFVLAVRWAADAGFFASIDANAPELVIWHPHGTERRRMDVPVASFPSIAVSPDGRRIAVGAPERTLTLWDPAAGQQVGKTITLADAPFSLTFAPDGSRLVVGGNRPAVYAIDGSTSLGHLVPGNGPRHAVWSPDGSLLAVAANDGRAVLADGGTGRLLAELPGVPADSPYRLGQPLAFSPDGRTLAIAGDLTLRLYDVASRQVRAESTGAVLGYAYQLRFSPDGRQVAVSGRQGATLFDAATGQPAGDPIRIPALGPGGATQLEYSPDGRTLYLSPINQPAVAHDLASARVTATLDAGVSSIAVSPDGSTVAASIITGHVALYEAATLRPLGPSTTFGRQLGGVLRFTPDGRHLVAWSLDRVLSIIDVGSFFVFEPGFPTPQVPIGRFDIDPSGARLAAPADNGTLLWDIDPGAWKQRACQVAGRNLTAEEWSRFLPNSGARRPTCDNWPLPA